MSSGSGLPPAKHAPFAVISRLISCLVTEQLLHAFYISAPSLSLAASGIMVVLSTHLTRENLVLNRPLNENDVYVIVPLRQSPIFSGKEKYSYGSPVGLVDPLDMIPVIYQFGEIIDTTVVEDPLLNWILEILTCPNWKVEHPYALRTISDPILLWRKFVDGCIIQNPFKQAIEDELLSSLEWQLAAYTNPPSCPNLNSPPIDWEQSLVAGHPTHPMHRARMLAIKKLNAFQIDWYHPRIRFVRVPRSSMDLFGPFDILTRQLVEKIASKAEYPISHDCNMVYMPVHELQLENVVSKFYDIEVLPEDISLIAHAQSSIRTVIAPDLPGMALKLAVGVKISSALRTISHFTANFGPRFSSEIVPKLSIDRTILTIALEPASAVYKAGRPETIKHLTAVIREEYQPIEGEVLIVCAALLEMDHNGAPVGVSLAQHTFGLDTYEKRVNFLDRYVQLSCEALLPPLLYNGVAFEAHAQNTLARFRVDNGELVGFVIRDLGGLRIHPQTLYESTGVDFQFLPGHCIVTGTVEETFPKFYHTYIHNHIQRLIRVLDLHRDGRGWEILRKHLDRVIPRSHGLWKAWMDSDSATVPSKCLLRMRLSDSYSEMIYCNYPNIIQYRPTPEFIKEPLILN